MKSPAALVARLFVLGAVCLSLSAPAMTVRAPSFPELVSESSAIVRARVVGVVSRRIATPQGETIKTFVTFEVAKSLKGDGAPKLTLAFLGGTVGLDRLEVPGMPEFQHGAEDYLFVAAGPSICPLVGAMHGRFRLVTAQKEGRPYVARDDQTPLVELHDLALPSVHSGPQAASVATRLTPEAFEAAIAAEVAHPTVSAAQP